MAFQIKDFTSIVASMINHAKASTNRITDFNVGSVARTIFEASAVEIDELYQQIFIGLREAIQTAIYASFGFTRLAATAATNTITVSITPQAADVTIPAGTRFSFAGGATTYSSLADVTITIGNSSGDVLVSADVAGVAGNIDAGQAFSAQPSPTGFVSATNALAFTNGTEEETNEQLQDRFSGFIASISRGTLTSLDFGLRTVNLTNTAGIITERVTSVSLVEPYVDNPTNPVGWVQAYIHNGVSGASAELLARAVEVVHGYYDDDGVAIPGWKAAGVQVDIAAATALTVDVTGVITVLLGYDSATLISEAEAEITEYLQGVEIGHPALFAEIISIVMALDGVDNFVVSAPTADTASTATQKILPGTLTITAA